MDKKQWVKLLDMVPDEDLREKLNARWSASSNDTTPREKWLELVDGVEKILLKGQNNLKRTSAGDQRKRNLVELRTCLPEIVFAYLYPRLDANVSKQRNHLLKSPFAVHPKTGRVCVPVSADAIEDFDPFGVPTLGQLQDELNQVSAKDATGTLVTGENCGLCPFPMYNHCLFCVVCARRRGQDIDERVRAVVRVAAAQAAGCRGHAEAARGQGVERRVQRRLVEKSNRSERKRERTRVSRRCMESK